MVGSGDYSRDRFGQEEVHARGGNLYIMLAVAYCMLLLPWFGEYIYIYTRNIAVSFNRYSAHLYIEAAYRRPTNASAILRVSQRDVISIHHIDSDATAAAADILDGWILSPPTAMYASSSSSSTVSYAPIRVYIIMPRLQTELLSRLQAARLKPLQRSNNFAARSLVMLVSLLDISVN